jgi:hypothetical protein
MGRIAEWFDEYGPPILLWSVVLAIVTVLCLAIRDEHIDAGRRATEKSSACDLLTRKPLGDDGVRALLVVCK